MVMLHFKTVDNSCVCCWTFQHFLFVFGAASYQVRSQGFMISFLYIHQVLHTYVSPAQYSSSELHVPFLVHWEVNEWSDRLIDLRCVNGSSPGEKVSSCSLFFTTSGFFVHLYYCFLFFLWDRILPSPHNSMTLFKSYRLIKVIDWLLGAWLFPPVYLPVLERVPVCTNVW